MKHFACGLAFAALALAGCGGEQNAVDNTADQLEEAAEQSTPAAAEVLENRADAVIEQNSLAPANGALEAAGNAQVGLPETGNAQ